MVLVNTIIFGWDMLSRLRALQWRFSSCCLFGSQDLTLILGGHYHFLLPVLFLLPNLARFEQRPARVPASLLRLWPWCGPGLSRQQGTRLITLPQHSQPSLAHYTTQQTPRRGELQNKYSKDFKIPKFKKAFLLKSLSALYNMPEQQI